MYKNPIPDGFARHMTRRLSPQLFYRTLIIWILCVVLLGITPLAGGAIILPTDQIAGVAYEQQGLTTDQMVSINAACGMLATSQGDVLWARFPQSRNSIASITKVMTAIVALDNVSVDDQVYVSWQAASVGESSAELVADQYYSMDYLLRAMLLISGNDAAMAIAEHVAENRKLPQEGEVNDGFIIGSPSPKADFVKMMNDKAFELGMKETRFANPSGLDEQGHYSSAEDVITMVTYAMKNEQFREIVASQTLTMPNGDVRTNTNELLGTYEGANGVKTGMTFDAGECLAASAKRGDIELYSVILAASSNEERFSQSATLLDFGFEHYATRVLLEPGSKLKDVEVGNYLDTTIAVGVDESVSATYFDLLDEIEEDLVVPPLRAPIKVGDTVGTVSFLQDDEVLVTAPVVALEAIEKPGFFKMISIEAQRLWRSISS